MEQTPKKIPLYGSKREFALLYTPEFIGEGKFGCPEKGFVTYLDEQGRLGLMNARGKILLPSQYDWTKFLFNRDAGILIGKTTRTDILCDLEGTPLAGENLSQLLQQRGVPVRDKNGELLYLDAIRPFNEGVALGKKNDRYYFVDTRGQVVLRGAEGVEFQDFHEGMAAFSRSPKLFHKRKYGFINRAGKVAIPETYNMVGGFSQGLAAVQDSAGWRFIRPDGSELKTFVTPQSNYLDWALPTVKAPHYFENAYTIVMRGTTGIPSVDGWTVLHKSGEYTGCTKVLLELTEEEGVFRFSDDTYNAPQRCYGLVDAQGNVLLQEEYQLIKSIGHGVFILLKDGKCGLADKTGKILAPVIWDNMVHKTDMPGFAMEHAVIVTKYGKRGLMDFQSNLLMPPVYSSSILYNGDLALVLHGEEGILLNLQQSSALPDEIKIRTILMDGLLQVTIDGKVYFLDYGCDA